MNTNKSKMSPSEALEKLIELSDKYDKCAAIIRRQLKVLEIIKEKHVDVGIDIYGYNTYEEYLDNYKYYYDENYKLEEPEWNLLKDEICNNK